MRPTTLTQAEKGAACYALHARDGAFIIPNPWDIGTARLLVHLGFEALATTSAGYAFSVGQRDGTIGRDETMAHVAAIVSATDLPVSADLENGFGEAPRASRRPSGLLRRPDWLAVRRMCYFILRTADGTALPIGPACEAL